MLSIFFPVICFEIGSSDLFSIAKCQTTIFFFYFVRQLNNIILRNYQLPHCMFSNFVLSPECYMVPSTALYMRWTTKFFDLNLKLLYIEILNRRRKKMNEKKLNLLIRFRIEVIKLTLKPIFARSNGYDWKIIFTFMSNYFVCDLFSLTQQHIFFSALLGVFRLQYNFNYTCFVYGWQTHNIYGIWTHDFNQNQSKSNTDLPHFAFTNTFDSYFVLHLEYVCV